MRGDCSNVLGLMTQAAELHATMQNTGSAKLLTKGSLPWKENTCFPRPRPYVARISA